MLIAAKLIKAFLRHLLPIGATALFLFLIQLLPGLLIVAVFIIDDAFVLSEFLMVLLAYAGIALVTSLLTFPPALFFEWLASKSKILIFLIPVELFAASTILLVGIVSLPDSEELFKTLFDLGSYAWLFLFLFSIIFSFYWSVLWFGRAIVHSLRVGIKILIYALFGGKGKSDLATHSSV